MAAKNKPPQSVLMWHTKMVRELDELFPVKQQPWIKTCNQVQMAGLLSAADLGEVTNMFVLFIKLMEKDKIKYGKYKRICDILKPYNADAGKLIEYYTGLIKEAFSKTGKRKYSSNSDSGLEDEGDWRNRRDVPLLIINNKSYNVRKGNTVLLQCAITSTTDIRNVQWKRKRKGHATFRDIKIENTKYFGGFVSTPSLTIHKTKKKDNGAKYVCYAINDAGTAHSDEIHVTVTEPETDAAGAGKMTFCEMLKNAMKEAEDQISVFVRSLGEIKDFKITSDRDTRQITVQVTVQNDIRGYEECLQKQIQSALGFKQRIVNLQIVRGCVIVSFDITGATHPWQASALALADKFSTGLNKGSIRLTDETGKPLQIQRDSIKITLKGTDDAAVDVNLPMVSIDQAAYCGVIGDIAILKSRLITSTHITSVRWFRINNDNGTEHAIEIDNKKYFGGAIESPSLVIDDTTVEDAGRYVCHADNRFGVGKSFATSLYIFNSENIETVFAALQAETSLTDSQSEGSSETTSDDDSMTHTLTENESHDKFLTSAVAGGHTNTEKLLLEKGRDHYDVPFQGLAAEDNPPSEVLKIHSETVEKLGKRKHTHDFDSETEAKEGNSKRRKRKRKISSNSDSETENEGRESPQRTGKRKTSRDSNSETENEGRESPQRKDNPKTSLALQAKTLPTASDDRSMAQQVPENMSPVSRFDMATDFTRPQEVLNLHTEMVQKLGELFPVNATKWQNIKNEVQMRNLLPVADAEELETMYDLFIRLVQKKDNGITYGEYTRIRTIIGSCNSLAEEIIDHYTGLIQAFYKDVPTFEPTKTLYSVKKGQIVLLECKLNESKTAIVNVQWKKKAKGNDAFIDIDIDGERYVGGSVKAPSICIKETKEKDNGDIYICQAKNAAGTGKSDEIRLEIRQPEQETASRDTGELDFVEMWRNITRKTEAEIEVFANAFGKIKGFSLTLELDVRGTNIGFIVQNDSNLREPLQQVLQQQIAKRYDVENRIFNITFSTGSSIVSFDITGATHPLDVSALALAERFRRGLQDGLILDETGNPIQIQRDSIKITMKEMHDATADVITPMVSIDQAAYCSETGSIAILTSRLLSSTRITSVTWFRINNDDGTEHVIDINNEKYIGGSVESPSLVIVDATIKDEGRYVCHAENSHGVGKSFSTSLCIFNSDNLETFLALQAETSQRDCKSSSGSKTTSADLVTEKESHDNVFVSAATDGHTETAKQLLEKRIDPYDYGDLALAAGGGDTDTVQVLLEMGADPNQYGVLKSAAGGGHTDTVKRMVEMGANPDTYGVLESAAGGGHTQTVELLVEMGADPKRVSVLDSAAGRGRTNIVKLLLGKGANPKIYNAFESAAAGGHKDVVELLLEEKLHPKDYPAALKAAMSGGYKEIVQLLLERGAEPTDYPAALKYAMSGGYNEIVQLLLERGADPNAYPALESAAEGDQFEIIKLLLEHGADPNKYSALEKAAERGHKEIVQLLLKNKADPNKYPALRTAVDHYHIAIVQLPQEQETDTKQCRALKAARDQFEIFKLLLEHGADPNKDPALESAAARGSLEIVKLLLEHGADPNKCLALELAAAGGYMDIVQLLLEKGADLSKVPPLDVLRLHAQMIKKLVEISSDKSSLQYCIYEYMKSIMHLSRFDWVHRPTMNDLFVEVKRIKKYEYGEYTAIIRALHEDAHACEIINYYTPLIKEAFSKKGKRDESRDSDPETEADKSESKQRKEIAGEVGQQYDDMQASGSNV